MARRYGYICKFVILTLVASVGIQAGTLTTRLTERTRGKVL
jgi:hypothetical protein